MDFFNEWIVKKKKNVQDIMTIIVTVMAALLIMYFILIQFSAVRLVGIIPIELALVVFGVYVIVSSLNIEFEYSVTNGDLDIDKITAKRRRKRLVSVKLRDFEYFARLDDKHISVAEDSSINTVIDASSSIDSPNVYFAIYYNNSEKICLLFEPTEKMIENFSHYIPRSLNHTL